MANATKNGRLPAGITARTKLDGTVVFDVRHRTPTRGQRRRTFDDLPAAKRYLAELRLDLARDRYIDPHAADRTVAEIAALWVCSNPAKRASSVGRDDIDLRLRILPAFGHRPISAIRPEHVQAAVNEWLVTLSPATVSRTRAVLHAVFDYALHDLELIARNPARRTRIGILTPRPARILTAEETSRLLDAFGGQHRTAIHLTLETGLRWSEAFGLRASSIDAAHQTLAVTAQVNGDAPKSRAGRRTIALSQGMTDLLDALATQRLAADGGEANPLLFQTTTGTPVDKNHWRQRVWVPGCNAAGLAGLRFHDLRKNNATRLLQAGIDIRTAQARLGHADVRTTLTVYAQATTTADRAAADALSGFLPTPSRR